MGKWPKMLYVYVPKTVPENLIWSESAQWLQSSSIPKIPGALITPMDIHIMPPWQMTMTLYIYGRRRFQWTWLFWSERIQWLLSSDIHKISGARITPMVMPIMPPWVKDHDVAHVQAKTIPINLIWSELVSWMPSSSGHKIPGAFITAMGMPILPPWANDHRDAHLQTKTVPMNLILSKLAQWLLSSVIHKILEAFIMPMGMAIMPHDVAKTVPMNLIWSGSAQWLQRSNARKIPGARITPMGMPIMPPNVQMTMTVHMYRPRRFQWTRFGVNWPCS